MMLNKYNKITAKAAMLLMLIVLSLTIIAAEANAIDYTAPGNVNFRITLINQDPDPVEPGNFVDVRFRVENIGTRRADNPEFEIIPEAPLSVASAEAVKTTGSIGGFQTGDDAVIIKFRLEVDPKASQGTGKVKLKYKYDATSPVVQTSIFDINIQTQNPIVVVKDINVEPEIITPGKSFLISANIKNTADTFVKNLRIKLELSSTTLPFAPVGSTNEKSIEVLASKESANTQFKMIAAPDAASALYKVPITVSYYDASGKNYSVQYITGIVVGEEPKLGSLMQETTLCELKKAGVVKIKIFNKENVNVKFLETTLKESDSYEIISPAITYVGKLDSDDYEEVEYTLVLKNNVNQLPLTLAYKDSNNNHYVEQVDVPFKMCSLEKNGQRNPTGLVAGIIIVLAIIVVYFLVFRKKKKHN